ncbi:MAG: metallophosphoesterase [Casimicrobiaceae bacterium]
MKRTGAAIVATLLAGCVLQSTPPSGPAEYRYVLLGPDGGAVARVITVNAQCPTIDVDGAPRAMTVRMPPATIPVRPSRPDLPTPKASAFPVLTCEMALPAGATRATIGGQSLPLPKANPRRIVVIGDTGCLVNSSYQIFQGCDDPALWPYPNIANAAAALAPDLVIHVGDYHYRESACAPGNAGCAGSPWGYGWDAWQADFFQPSVALTAAAPWIVVRGNHESCNRAGQGWWRFLDPRPAAPRQDCNLAADDDIGNYSDAYIVPLGGSIDTQFIVFDSSNVGVTPLNPADLMYRNYKSEMEYAFARTAQTPRVFFMSHHPILGFAANPGQPEKPYPGNAGLQSVLSALYSEALFPANVATVLSGHNHVFEFVSFSSPHPPQFISGNGGDRLDEPFPVPFPPNQQPAPGAVIADLAATSHFGFMSMDRVAAGWLVSLWDVRGALISTCTLDGREAHCKPLPKP